MRVDHWTDPDWDSFSDQSIKKEIFEKYNEAKEKWSKKKDDRPSLNISIGGKTCNPRSLDDTRTDKEINDWVRSQLDIDFSEEIAAMANTELFMYLCTWGSGFTCEYSGRIVLLDKDIIAKALSHIRSYFNYIKKETFNDVKKETGISSSKELMKIIGNNIFSNFEYENIIDIVRSKLIKMETSREKLLMLYFIKMSKIKEVSSPDKPLGLEGYYRLGEEIEQEMSS